MTEAPVSVGVAASLGPDLIARIAGAVEDAGLAALWVNDNPGADALAALGAAARSTSTLRLATGVLPVDRRSTAEILAAVRTHAIPLDRLTLGVGSGRRRTGALALVRDSVPVLREALGCRVVVGALGPRMRRLGAETADGVLLSWLPPAIAAEQAAQAHAADPAATAALYVRTAFDEAGRERMRQEAERYSGFPQYAANFARLGIEAGQTVLPVAGEDVRPGLRAYRQVVDEVVLRAIVAEDDIDAYRAFAARAAEAAA